jgi:hypothetical protein
VLRVFVLILLAAITASAGDYKEFGQVNMYTSTARDAFNLLGKDGDGLLSVDDVRTCLLWSSFFGCRRLIVF